MRIGQRRWRLRIVSSHPAIFSEGVEDRHRLIHNRAMAAERSALFICKGNWFRSQVAAAIYNKTAGAQLAQSAGTYAGAPDEPEGQRLADLFPTPHFFEVMEGHGLFVRENKTRRLTPQMLGDYDVVVSMAEEPFIPDFLAAASNVTRWSVANPRVVDQAIAEATFEQVATLVAGLFAMTAPAART